MRIAISGASGTGKTTIAKVIAERFNIPLNPVGARSVSAGMGLDNPYDVDRLGLRVEFQGRLFQQKRDWEAQHEHFVTDRSYFDNLVYCMLHMGSALPDGSIASYQASMTRYEVVFRLQKRDFQDLNDGVRVKGETYHWAYERLLSDLYSIPTTPSLTLQGSKCVRLESALRTLNALYPERA